jgi:hypothetical protein
MADEKKPTNTYSVEYHGLNESLKVYIDSYDLPTKEVVKKGQTEFNRIRKVMKG